MKKKLLTIDELVRFCQEQKFYNFSSKDTGYQLAVQIPAVFEKDDVQDDTMLFCNVKLMHTGKNRNSSALTEKAAKKLVKRGFAYVPILANFTEDSDGNPDFVSHDFIIDDDGEIEYIEHQVGCFTTKKPYLEQDPNNENRQYIYCQAAIPREYTKAAEIIERKNGSKISAEIGVNEMSYDLEEKVLLLEDVVLFGATCLGVDDVTKEPIEEGMEGAKIQIEDFSQENNSIISHYSADEKLIETLDKLNELLSNFNIDKDTQKGGLRMTKFEELLEKYGKSLDDITFDYDGLTDDELEAKFAEEFFDGEDPADPADPTDPADPENPDTSGSDTPGSDTPGGTTPGSDTTGSDTPGGTTPSTDTTPEPTEADQTAATAVATLIGALTDDSTELEVAAVREAYDALTDIQKGLVSAEVLAVLTAQETRITEEKNLKIDDSETPESKKIADSYTAESYAVITTDGRALEFAVSMNDTITALSELVNSTYSEQDNAWYSVIAYDDHVVMIDYFTGSAYRQQYKKRNGTMSLVGDRVSVSAVYLTSDEEKALDELKANFASASAELDKYRAAEEKAKKQDLMSSDDYRSIFDKDEFKDIDIDKFSLDELTAHLDEVLLKYAKEGNLNFSSTPAENKPNEHKKLFGQPSKRTKKGRYGSIFKKN